MKKHRINLWQKIFLVGMVPVIVVVSFLSTASFNRAKDVSVSQTQKAMADQIKRIDLSINTHTRQIESSLDALVEILENRYANEFPGIRAEDQAIINNYTRTIMNTFSEIRSVIVLWNNGIITNTGTSRVLNSSDVLLLEEEARENPKSKFWTRHNVNEGSSENDLLLSRSMLDGNNEYLGTVVLEVSERIMANNLMVVQRINQNQTTFIMNKSGGRIYSDNYLSYDIQDLISEAYKNGLRHGFVEDNKKSYYVYMQYSVTPEWILCSSISEEDLFTGSSHLKKYILAMVFSCLLVTAILTYLLSRMIISPLKKLNDVMQKVQGDDLSVYVENHRNDETKELTDSFNYMIQRLRDLINRVYVEELARKNAEMEALQAQINPHFLYNTLDSINWMLISRGQNDISEVIVALGGLLRYSVDTRSPLVTLKDEYANIHNYLLLQKNRLEDKFDYELDLYPDVESFLIPRLTLQPLVENAIIHGILATDNPGYLWAIAHRVDDTVEIEIKDNGIGMDKEKLALFKSLCSGESGTNNIGIQNVIKRLRLQYDTDIPIIVDSIEKCGTSVKLILPIKKEKTDENCSN